uniref:Putative tc1 transposase tc1-like transposase n=1 Tax=Ornithodoros turicata TaxID=34597 RepID=A0A2R5LJX6_9ACAR
MPLRVSRENRLRVIELHKAGVALRKISKQVGCSVVTAFRICQAYRKENRVRDARRSTRRTVTTDEEDLKIFSLASLFPDIPSAAIRHVLKLEASEMTILHRLHSVGLRVACKTVRPTEDQRRQRLELARKCASWNAEHWDKIVFSSITVFSSRTVDETDTASDMVLCSPDEILSILPHVVTVWGILTCHGLGPLTRVEGRFTEKKYSEIIDQVALPYLRGGPYPDGSFTLQHGCYPPCLSPIVEDHLEMRGVSCISWPANSRDIHPIEEVWGIIRSRLKNKESTLRSPDTLWEVILQEWEELRGTNGYAAGLVASVPHRLSEVLASEGERCDGL